MPTLIVPRLYASRFLIDSERATRNIRELGEGVVLVPDGRVTAAGAPEDDARADHRGN